MELPVWVTTVEAAEPVDPLPELPEIEDPLPELAEPLPEPELDEELDPLEPELAVPDDEEPDELEELPAEPELLLDPLPVAFLVVLELGEAAAELEELADGVALVLALPDEAAVVVEPVPDAEDEPVAPVAVVLNPPLPKPLV